jgi:hypothetical protein
MAAPIAPLELFDHFVDALLEFAAARQVEPSLFALDMELPIGRSDRKRSEFLAFRCARIAVRDLLAYAVQHGAFQAPGPTCMAHGYSDFSKLMKIKKERS